MLRFREFLESNGFRYYDIGHHGKNNLIWFWDQKNKKILVHSGDTDHDLVRDDAFSLWRGRYDNEKNVLSIIHPDSSNAMRVPQKLKSLLTDRFPSSLYKGFGVKW